MTKQEVKDLREAYFEGKERSEDMLKLFEYVDTLVAKVSELKQGQLFYRAED